MNTQELQSNSQRIRQWFLIEGREYKEVPLGKSIKEESLLEEVGKNRPYRLC